MYIPICPVLLSHINGITPPWKKAVNWQRTKIIGLLLVVKPIAGGVGGVSVCAIAVGVKAIDEAVVVIVYAIAAITF
jgi:hypothetical protein